MTRSLCFLTLTGTVIGTLSLSCLNHMNKTAFRVGSHLRRLVDKYFLDYNSIRISAIGISLKFSGIILTALTTVFVLTIVSSYTSIRLRSQIPRSIYLFFPAAGLFPLISIQVILSLFVAINDTTNGILKKCRLNISRSSGINYAKRRFRTMQSISFHGEILGLKLYKCCRLNRTEYFSLMLNYTVTALMTQKTS